MENLPKALEKIQEINNNLGEYKEWKQISKDCSLMGLVSAAYLGIRYFVFPELDGDLSTLSTGILTFGGFVSSLSHLVSRFEIKKEKNKLIDAEYELIENYGKSPAELWEN